MAATIGFARQAAFDMNLRQKNAPLVVFCIEFHARVHHLLPKSRSMCSVGVQLNSFRPSFLVYPGLLPCRIKLALSGPSAHARLVALELSMRWVPGWQPLDEPKVHASSGRQGTSRVFDGDHWEPSLQSIRAPVGAGGAAHRP